MQDNQMNNDNSNATANESGKRTIQFPHLEEEFYLDRYTLSVNDRLSYWSARAEEYLDWQTPFKQVEVTANGQTQWFVGGELNPAYNCLDRHLEYKGDDIAIIWCCEEQGVDRKISYKQLHSEVSLMANGLHALGLREGDKICMYATMLPEIIVSMLACARQGIVYEFINMDKQWAEIEEQVRYAQPKMLITADHGCRSGIDYPFFANAEKLCESYESIEKLVVIRNTGMDISLQETRDFWYHDLTRSEHPEVAPANISATSPLFLSYRHDTPGHHFGFVNAGYLLYCALTHRYVFDYQDGDIFWCAADFNEVTGHAIAIWGALANGATTVIYDGNANDLPYQRFWQIVEQYQVNILYARENGLETMVAYDAQVVERESWRSLRVVGLAYSENNQSVIDACQRLSFDHCVIITTTNLLNTGQILFAHTAAAQTENGMGDPFFGIIPVIVDDNGEPIEETVAKGRLKLAQSWPSQNCLTVHPGSVEVTDEPKPLVGQWQRDREYIHTGLNVSRTANGNFYLLNE